MKIEIGSEEDLPGGLPGALMILWAVTWGARAVARLIDGPRVALMTGGEVPFGALQYADVIVGLAVAIAVGWAGGRLFGERSGARRLALGALAILILHRIVLVAITLAAADKWLSLALGRGLLADIVLAGAAAWFILSKPRPEDVAVPRVADLAILILIGRDALILLAPPVDLIDPGQLLRMLSSAPIELAAGALSMVLGMAVLALALARLGGARNLTRPTSTIVAASLFFAFMLLGMPSAGYYGSIPGVATRITLYVMGIAALIERGLLLSVLNDRHPEK